MLFEHYFEAMYTNGIIDEELFDFHHVPLDTNSDGTVVDRNLSIVSENRQRCKVLSAVTQVNERKELLFSKHMDHYNKKKNLFLSESKVCEMNERAEGIISSLIMSLAHKDQGAMNNNTVIMPIPASEIFLLFSMISNSVTYALLSENVDKIVNDKLKVFLRVRTKVTVRGSKLYYSNVPVRKDDLMSRVVELHNHPRMERKFPTCPLLPCSDREQIE